MNRASDQELHEDEFRSQLYLLEPCALFVTKRSYERDLDLGLC